MKLPSKLLLSLAPLFGGISLHAGDYLPDSGDLHLGFSLSQTTFDQFYAGDARQPGVPGGGEIKRNSYRAYFAYGLNEGLAADLSIGYASASSNLTDSSHITNTHLGLNWQTMNTDDGDAVDLLFRAGIVIDGGYETGLLSAPGDGENGIEVMARVGKTLNEHGFRLDAEAGYSVYDSPVPDSYYLRFGPTLPIANGFSVDVSGILFSSSGGIDIGGAGFGGLGDLPKVEEKGEAGELGLSYAHGNAYYRLSISELFDGENIGDEFTIGLFSSFKF